MTLKILINKGFERCALKKLCRMYKRFESKNILTNMAICGLIIVYESLLLRIRGKSAKNGVGALSLSVGAAANNTLNTRRIYEKSYCTSFGMLHYGAYFDRL